jgi:hypothetical protein
MCFSPEASFIASGGLAAAGAASVKIARRQQLMIALVPFLFAIQQAIEGVQWLYLGRGESSTVAAYAFLFFGFVLWPIYVPLAIHSFDAARRRVLRWFIAAGCIVSLLYVVGLVMNPLAVRVFNHSIDYGMQVPLAEFASVAYLLTVFGALIVSSYVFVRWLGVIILVFAGITQVFYYATFASVWCFFAAVTSGLILWFLWQNVDRKG